MKKIKANKRVLVINGLSSFERAVYVAEDGREYFIYKGDRSYIFRTERGIYKAPWFTQVKYIED